MAAMAATEAPPGRRVFLNHLDSYCGRSIGQYLSSCVVGATLGSPEEEEEDENGSDVEVPTTSNEEIYEIVGTLSKPGSTNPRFAKETYVVSSREALLSHLLECEIVVYNITEDVHQIEEATWAASALHKKIETFAKQKLFILVSTIMTWGNTKPPDPENPETPLSDEDFRKRKSHPSFMDYINAEKHIAKLGKTNKEKFSTYVVASGHQYGAEEGLFHYFFKMCWLGETPAIPVFGDGNNIIPTIHICDLAAVLQNVADHRPEFQYILAVDTSMHTLEELVKEKIVAKEPDNVRADGEGEDDVEEEGENIEEAKELLDGIKENMKQNKGRLGDEYLIKVMTDKLMSMPCRNQGYVLDGFPETYAQAMELFKVEDDEEEEEETKGKMPKFNKIIIPEFIFSLTASDEFLINRIINLPESVVAGTRYTEDQFLQSLKLFRKLNTDDTTVLNYFDELEIHPQFIDVAVYEDSENRLTVPKIIQKIGEPRNYGLTDEEKEVLERQAAEERLVKEAQEKAEQERKEAEERAERMARWEEWNKQLEEVKRQEQELVEAQSIPLRNYLMKNVMPTLMQGINECCRIRPDDPVNFLAEYLFKNSPDIDWNKR
ncbi:adenylate kinase 7 isoform X5 [Aphelocoma coerulescens]|uniref:adenylate kinase 7 isoform X5 n=1 Tax=Aphelocoma coerulescens TaxID=39617 RepID=UPI0036053D12